LNRITPTALIVALALAVATLNAGDDAKEKAKKDIIAQELKRLEGTWELVSEVYDGKKVEQPASMVVRAEIRGEDYAVSRGGRVFARAKLKVDPVKKPKTLDMEATEGPVKGKTFFAVYELKGDELRVCGADSERDRPGEFAAPAGSKRLLDTYRRVKPEP
jgi:uncharacterized protein (TIGR03067 family)